MTLTQQIITIGMGILGVQLLRWLPFIIFPANRPIPQYIRYLGQVLPAAMFGMLVIYCYKDINLLIGNHGIPNFIAGAITLILHFWKRNMFLSISIGTGVYMFLLQQDIWGIG